MYIKLCIYILWYIIIKKMWQWIMILRNCYSNSKNSTKKTNQNSSGCTWSGKLFLSQKHGMHTELCSAWKRVKEQKAYFFAGDAIVHWYWHRFGQFFHFHFHCMRHVHPTRMLRRIASVPLQALTQIKLKENVLQPIECKDGHQNWHLVPKSDGKGEPPTREDPMRIKF